MITLQFSTERAIDSALIRFLTWSDISHVDVVFPHSLLFGARFRGGVNARPDGYAKWSHSFRATVAMFEPAEKRFYDALTSQQFKPYDWKGILNFAHQRNWRDESAWFCSELVAWAFEKAGFPLLNIGADVWRVTPRDLLLSPFVKRITQ